MNPTTIYRKEINAITYEQDMEEQLRLIFDYESTFPRKEGIIEHNNQIMKTLIDESEEEVKRLQEERKTNEDSTDVKVVLNPFDNWKRVNKYSVIEEALGPDRYKEIEMILNN